MRINNDTQSESGLPSVGCCISIRAQGDIIEKRTGSIKNEDDILSKRLAIASGLLQCLEDKVAVLLLSFRAFDVTDSVG